jgi:hypothetical protein
MLEINKQNQTSLSEWEWVSEWVCVREGIAGRTYQCCHTARANDARFSTYLLHVQHYTMHKIRHKTRRNKMLICSCGVPPKSCSRVIGLSSLSCEIQQHTNVWLWATRTKLHWRPQRRLRCQFIYLFIYRLFNDVFNRFQRLLTTVYNTQDYWGFGPWSSD